MRNFPVKSSQGNGKIENQCKIIYNSEKKRKEEKKRKMYQQNR